MEKFKMAISGTLATLAQTAKQRALEMQEKKSDRYVSLVLDPKRHRTGKVLSPNYNMPTQVKGYYDCEFHTSVKSAEDAAGITADNPESAVAFFVDLNSESDKVLEYLYPPEPEAEVPTPAEPETQTGVIAEPNAVDLGTTETLDGTGRPGSDPSVVSSADVSSPETTEETVETESTESEPRKSRSKK